MLRIRVTAVLLLVAVASLVSAAEVTLRASVDRTQVFAGERFTLSLRFSGTSAIDAPDLRLDNFRVNYIGPMTRMESIDGRVNTSVTHRYSLTAPQAGSYKLGPLRIAYDGSVLESEAIDIEVVARGGAAASARTPRQHRDGLELLVKPAKPSAFIGERVDLTIRLLVADVRVDDLNYPEIAGEGFALDDISRPTQRSEIVDGRRVQSLEFRTTLTPLRVGNLAVGPVTMSMDIIEARGRRTGDPLFDRFLGVTHRRPVEISADPVSLDIKALPERGRPEDFSGAVGRFALKLSASPTTVSSGDPVTVRIEISGSGNLASIRPPRVPVDERFRAYDPLPAEPGNAHARAFEQVIIPRTADITEIPAVRFSYFDPTVKVYRSIVRGPIALSVGAGAVQSGPAVVALDSKESSAEAEEPLGRDIVYIKERPGRLMTAGTDTWRSLGFWGLQALPPGIFVVALYLRKRRERIGADPRLVRYRQSGKRMRIALRQLSRSSSGDSAQFYDALTAAFHDYLAAKLGLPPGGVELERVVRQLRSSGIDDTTCDKVTALFTHIETARYAAGSGAHDNREEPLALAEEIVTALERSRTLVRQLGVAAVIIAMLAATAALAPAQSNSDPMGLFFLGNRAYADGDYAGAAEYYRRIVADGYRSGAVYFNLGNASYKLHQTGQAIANYERARRLLPRDPDVTANLGYAREEASLEVAQTPLAMRVLAPLATRATASELLALNTVLWWLAWIALTAAQVLSSIAHPAWRLGSIAMALWLVAGLNLGVRWSQVEGVTQAVVVSDELSVRYEPNPSGTEHFRLTEGTRVEVRSRREDWLQIRRHDGLRGWAPRSSLEVL